jgi:hypothetical protein
MDEHIRIGPLLNVENQVRFQFLQVLEYLGSNDGDGSSIEQGEAD